MTKEGKKCRVRSTLLQRTLWADQKKNVCDRNQITKRKISSTCVISWVFKEKNEHSE